ncbi:molybdopterin synthase catalytic subunit MoaE [Gilvimarinus sp. 1_MG-2023]|uniref:molybdopterin synthase catalytic subunit MoaE n=1 Tax=Gilvimarinus sp. 1_MG-2023 TaxID=3062638 RepID=UPI0026E34A64|nr:molybdopterin synthase catalytic subunit MoaE [Gilvimarinus sp. 1_MG-2023]MDO6747693.1 molybdopterin synthase catalytic subunit MoaE [Gilvimarinus sp. 1_MG-2023]
MDSVSIQNAPFSAAEEYSAVSSDAGECGAVVLFTGRVRAESEANPVVALELEHYPGMTEQVLEDLMAEARRRWTLGQIRVVHRVGEILLGDEIVLVAVSAAHRREAFEACEYLMDTLKSTVPFWKKEIRQDGTSHWVAAKGSDEKAASRWG